MTHSGLFQLLKSRFHKARNSISQNTFTCKHRATRLSEEERNPKKENA